MSYNPELEAENQSPTFDPDEKSSLKNQEKTNYIENSNLLGNQNENSTLFCKKIEQLTRYRKPFLKRILLDIFDHSPNNAELIYDFIVADRDEINIKESTAE